MTDAPPPPAERPTPQHPVIKFFSDHPVMFGVCAGLLYGLIVQVAARTKTLSQVVGVMSFGFVFVLPVVLGFISAHLAGFRRGRSLFFYLGAPFATVIASLFSAMVFGWEGLICLILALPVYLAMGALGGLIAYAVDRALERGDHNGKLPMFLTGLMMILPPGTAAIESGLPAPLLMHKTHTEIAIAADVDTVWQHIIRVEPITEPTTGVFYKMGFPKPIEALLTHEGVGGVRHAKFEKDLVFIETIDEWVDHERLSFRINVDPNNTPLTTLDPHVTVGGEYFDVLRGTYWIEKRGVRDLVLHLESEFRLSTHFNAYAGVWGDFLMRDIQNSILRVLKARCEAP